MWSDAELARFKAFRDEVDARVYGDQPLDTLLARDLVLLGALSDPAGFELSVARALVELQRLLPDRHSVGTDDFKLHLELRTGGVLHAITTEGPPCGGTVGSTTYRGAGGGAP